MVPIASRTLKIIDGDGEREVVVRLFIPEEDTQKRCWKCAYEIGWPEEPRKFQAYGVDAVQGIQLAMQMIGIELYTSDFHKKGQLAL